MSHKNLSDADLDGLVIRELSRLPHLTPSIGFAGRVMARVRLPQPRAVALFHRARIWAAVPRHTLALAGGYALSAVVALGVVVPWLFNHSTAIRFATTWATERVLGVAREWALAAAGWAMSSGLTAAVRSLQLTAGQVWLTAGVLTTAYAASAVGLHYLLRAPRGNDATVQA